MCEIPTIAENSSILFIPYLRQPRSTFWRPCFGRFYPKEAATQVALIGSNPSAGRFVLYSGNAHCLETMLRGRTKRDLDRSLTEFSSLLLQLGRARPPLSDVPPPAAVGGSDAGEALASRMPSLDPCNQNAHIHIPTMPRRIGVGFHTPKVAMSSCFSRIFN